jgi:hypothetical protein
MSGFWGLSAGCRSLRSAVSWRYNCQFVCAIWVVICIRPAALFAQDFNLGRLARVSVIFSAILVLLELPTPELRLILKSQEIKALITTYLSRFLASVGNAILQTASFHSVELL